MGKRFLKVLICPVIALTLLTSCGTKKTSNNVKVDKKYVPVEVGTVKKDTVYNSSMIIGKIAGEGEVDIIPKIPGKVMSLSVKVGDAIRSGDTLAVLDKSDGEDRVKQAKIGLDAANVSIEQGKVGLKQAQDAKNSAEASYKVAKANYDMSYEKIQNAKTNLERSKKLYESGVISKAEYEQAQLAASDNSINVLDSQLKQAEKAFLQSENGIRQANTSIKQAQVGYEQAKVAYEQALKSVEDMTIKSPVDGIVCRVNIEKGEMASNVQPILTIVSLDKVYVKVDVTEKLVNKLKKWDKINTYIPSLSDKEFNGRIYSISPAANLQTNLYSVDVEISNKDHKIKQGMFAKVQFNTDYKKDVLVVKSEAVVIGDGNPVVYIEKDGKAIEKEVKLGIDNGKYVEIKSGLKLNDRVIEKGQNYVKDGSIVKVVGGDGK